MRGVEKLGEPAWTCHWVAPLSNRPPPPKSTKACHPPAPLPAFPHHKAKKTASSHGTERDPTAETHAAPGERGKSRKSYTLAESSRTPANPLSQP